MSLNKFARRNDVENTQDTVGGFQPLQSDIYNAVVKVAYTTESKNGATGVVLILGLDGREYRETLYITNRNGDVFYTKNNIKHYLPGFVNIDELCLVAAGKPLSECETEEKKVKVFNFETMKEEPTDVPVIMDLVGKEIKVAIVLEKQFKQAQGSNGYEDTDEVIERNQINKFFSTEGFTANEIKDGVEDADFYDKWIESNQGRVIDRTKKKKNDSGTGKGTPKRRSKPDSKPSSLFGDTSASDDDDLPF